MSTSAYFWIIGSMAKCLAMSLQSLPLAWVRDVSIRDVEPSSISNEVTFRGVGMLQIPYFSWHGVEGTRTWIHLLKNLPSSEAKALWPRFKHQWSNSRNSPCAKYYDGKDLHATFCAHCCLHSVLFGWALAKWALPLLPRWSIPILEAKDQGYAGKPMKKNYWNSKSKITSHPLPSKALPGIL